MGLALSWCRVELKAVANVSITPTINKEMYLQCIFHVLINFHDGSLITATITVVGCTKDGYYISVLSPVVSLSIMRG